MKPKIKPGYLVKDSIEDSYGTVIAICEYLKNPVKQCMIQPLANDSGARQEAYWRDETLLTFVSLGMAGRASKD